MRKELLKGDKEQTKDVKEEANSSKELMKDVKE
jgi:hypothetical protein